MRIGDMDTDKKYACPKCIKGTISCKEVTRGVFIAKCDKCGWEERIGINAEKHKCPRCPKEFQSYRDLQRHAKKIHGMSEVELNFEGYSKIIKRGKKR